MGAWKIKKFRPSMPSHSFSRLFLTAVPGQGTGVNRRHAILSPGRRVRRNAPDAKVGVDTVRASAHAGSIVRSKLLLAAARPHFHVETIDIAGHSIGPNASRHHKIR